MVSSRRYLWHCSANRPSVHRNGVSRAPVCLHANEARFLVVPPRDHFLLRGYGDRRAKKFKHKSSKGGGAAARDPTSRNRKPGHELIPFQSISGHPGPATREPHVESGDGSDVDPGQGVDQSPVPASHGFETSRFDPSERARRHDRVRLASNSQSRVLFHEPLFAPLAIG